MLQASFFFKHTIIRINHEEECKYDGFLYKIEFLIANLTNFISTNKL